MLIVRLEKGKDRAEILERGWEIRRNWGVGVDEDLTMNEKKIRWRLVERARLEKARGNVVVVTNRRIWGINGKAWSWDVDRDRWKEELGETEEESEE